MQCNKDASQVEAKYAAEQRSVQGRTRPKPNKELTEACKCDAQNCWCLGGRITTMKLLFEVVCNCDGGHTSEAGKEEKCPWRQSR